MPKIASEARILDAGCDTIHRIDYVACCHCGHQHAYRSTLDAHLRGEQRLGFCMRCNAPRCLTCVECVPFERQLENIEAGRQPLDRSRLSVVITGHVPG